MSARPCCQAATGASINHEREKMAKFKIAHLREQGVDLIIIPLDEDFGHKHSSEQRQIIAELQAGCVGARLAGTVVPVWIAGRQMNFIAPERWHPFFSSLQWNQVLANLNKELTIN